MRNKLIKILECRFPETVFIVVKVSKRVYIVVWDDGQSIEEVKDTVIPLIPSEKKDRIFFARCLSASTMSFLLENKADMIATSLHLEDTLKAIVSNFSMNGEVNEEDN